jgi:hypothetical protein
MGILEPEAAPVTRHRSTLKETFRIVRLSLDAERSPLRAVPSSVPAPTNPEPHDDGPPPDPSEYLGDETDNNQENEP